MPSMNLLSHIKKIKDQAAKNASNRDFSKNRQNIWYDWKDGDQVMRFVGDFIITKSHWMTPSPYNPLKLFDEKAFEGNNPLSKLVNCANWDIVNETERDGGCVVCLLNKISRDILRSSAAIDEETRKEFDSLKARTDFRVNYRWNVLLRDKPVDQDGKLVGYNIVQLGYELFEEIAAIHEEYSPAEFTSVEEGLDIKINKSGGGDRGGRTKYRAQAVFQGAHLKVTPLTQEERALDLFNLAEICGRQSDQDLVRSKLLQKWQELITEYEKGDESAEQAAPAPAPAPVVPKQSPVSAMKNAKSGKPF